MNYLNQKEISVNKQLVNEMYNKEGEKDFLHSLSWEKLLLVTNELDGNEFKIWMYLMKFTGKDKFYFSPAALTQYFNISESTAQRGFKRLEALGYLVKNSSVRGYDFHPLGRN